MNINYKKIFVGLAMSCAVMACDDDAYIDINKDPDGLTAIPPENQFLNATINVHNQDFEAFYDFYRRMMPWMQYSTPAAGNGEDFTSAFGNFYRYDRLYIGVGNALVDMDRQIEALPETERAKYVQMQHIGHILKAYYAFYVSDIFGSIAYSQALQARYDGTQLPEYDNQQTVFNTLDAEIKAAVAGLKETHELEQISLGRYDQYYDGDPKAWIKAGNALRVRIATRLVKRDRAKAIEIATDALSDAASLMQSNEDGWVMIGAAVFTNGGNFNPDGLYASQPIVSFMLDKVDPRLDAFVAPNGYSQENIDRLLAEGVKKIRTTDTTRYVGSFTSPDISGDQDIQDQYYTPRRLESNQTVDTLSLIQRRLFQPSFDGGTGVNYIPVITYADFCFNRAELATLGITTEDAAALYVKGVTASIEWYDEAAIGSKLEDYSALNSAEPEEGEPEPDEIGDYLAKPGIAFDASKALEQIAVQTYLNSFRQPSEGWAVWKRTGFPNSASTVLPLSQMTSDSRVLQIPRRAPLSPPLTTNPNYDNIVKAYAEMQKDAEFGSGPLDAFGRVWWDKQ